MAIVCRATLDLLAEVSEARFPKLLRELYRVRARSDDTWYLEQYGYAYEAD